MPNNPTPKKEPILPEPLTNPSITPREHVGYKSIVVINIDHEHATKTFINRWPIIAQIGSTVQIVNPTLTNPDKRRLQATILNLLCGKKERNINDKIAPTKIPSTGSPESTTSVFNSMLKSGIKWHSGSKPVEIPIVIVILNTVVGVFNGLN